MYAFTPGGFYFNSLNRKDNLFSLHVFQCAALSGRLATAGFSSLVTFLPDKKMH
jgi:hypothetical protein